MGDKEELLKEMSDCEEGVKKLEAIEKLVDIVDKLGWDILVPNLSSKNDDLPGLVIGDRSYLELVGDAVNEKLGVLDIDQYLSRH